MPLPNPGPHPRYLENLRIGGGYGAPGGGAEVDAAGNAALDGGLTVGGAIDARGGLFNSQDALAVPGSLEVDGEFRLGPAGVDTRWHAWLGAEQAQKSPSNGPSGPVYEWHGDFTGGWPLLEFSASVRQFASWLTALPADYDGRPILPELFWTAASGTTGQGVTWRMRLKALGALDAPSAPGADLGGPVTGIFQLPGTVHVASGPAGVPANAASGGLLLAQVDRQTSHAEDTLPQPARLLGVRLRYA